jgi:DNA invertase Pin-like site-specific DNA recombinase
MHPKIARREAVVFNSDLLAASPNPMPMPLRAVTLVRVSTADQGAEGKAGVPRQVEGNARVVRDKGYQVVHSVVLVDVSGTVTALAPEIQELIQMAERREFDVIVVAEMSRLIRPDDLSNLALLDQFRRNGVVIDAGGTVHDVLDPSGFLAGGLQALIGGFERKTMLLKIQRSKESARAAGRNPSADITLPLGLSYDRKIGTYHYNDDVSKVQEAFQLIDGDSGLRNISEIARRVGIEPATLRNILRNKAYIGVREYTQKRDLSVKVMKAGARQGDRPKVARKPEEIIRVRIIPPEEQAVSDEQFERVQQILAGLKDFHARIQSAREKGGNLLAGTGRCGCCGLRLYGTTSSRTSKDGATKARGHYVCFSHHYLNKSNVPPCGFGWVQKEQAEALVDEFVRTLLGDEAFIRKTLEHAASKRRDLIRLPDSDDHLRVRLAEVERKDKRIIDSLMADVLSIPEAKQARARVNEERESILRAIKAKENEETTDLDPVSARLMGRKDSWLALESTADRKQFLATIFAEIYLQNTKENGLVVSGFLLAPGLIPKGDESWGAVAELPVTLSEPFRIDPPPDIRPIGENQSLCKRCDQILPLDAFYVANKSSCKSCLQAVGRERYQHKKLGTD